jgi:hypothetical protein
MGNPSLDRWSSGGAGGKIEYSITGGPWQNIGFCRRLPVAEISVLDTPL